MNIGGVQKFSLIDYPGRISAIVFTQGCNFRCPYCHNPELVDPGQYGPLHPEEDVISFLARRRGKLDAVTLTGGEPTLQPDLDKFILEIKKMDFLVKVDTNGSIPDVLEKLIRSRLVDYLAMDLKGPLNKYGQITGADVQTEKIRKSIDLITNSGIAHEFRTTVVRSQLDDKDLSAMAELLKRARLYVLQKFVPVKTLNKKFLIETSFSPEEFSTFQRNREGKQPCIAVR